MSVYAKDYGYFFNSNSSDRTYSAESFETWLKPFFVSGVFTGGLQVQAQSTPDMTVKVTSGYANLDGKLAFWPADNTVSLSMASGVYDRIDTVVLRRDNTNRTISIEVVTGEASATPEPIAPVRTSTIYELVLAQILVGTGVTAISQDDITDTRLDTDICGYVCAAVDTPDFSDLYDQFTAQFMTWFNEMKDQLSEDAAGHLQQEVDDLDDRIDQSNENFADEFDESTTYIAGSYCIYNGVFYRAKQATVGEFIPELWDRVQASTHFGNKILVGSRTTINRSGSFEHISLPGLTGYHKVCNWGLSTDSSGMNPISLTEPPADITISCAPNEYTIDITNYTSNFYIKPIFILEQNR